MRLCRIENPNFISGTAAFYYASMPDSRPEFYFRDSYYYAMFFVDLFFQAYNMVKQTIKTVYNVWQKSDAENPIKTGIMPVDFVVGKTRYGRAWNVGFNIGKAAFVIKQSFEELQKKK